MRQPINPNAFSQTIILERPGDKNAIAKGLYNF